MHNVLSDVTSKKKRWLKCLFVKTAKLNSSLDTISCSLHRSVKKTFHSLEENLFSYSDVSCSLLRSIVITIICIKCKKRSVCVCGGPRPGLLGALCQGFPLFLVLIPVTAQTGHQSAINFCQKKGLITTFLQNCETFPISLQE